MRYLILLLILVFSSCERDLNVNVNYKYEFMAMYHKDDYGIKHWGGHIFITDEPINDWASFKECYVNYLDWSMGNELYKQIYYADRKNIQIKFLGTTRYTFTTPEVDLCN
jgi:hypothetical protein